MGGDEVAHEVLAYTDNGSFDYSSIPDNFKWWLSQYQQQITDAMNYAEAHPEATSAAKAKAARKTTRAALTDIGPLLQTQWNQGSPYNNAIPSLGENYKPLVTGCVATAMAQIMKYHNYPETGLGSKSYQQTWTNIGTIDFSADFANTTYDWQNMTNTYGSTSTQDEKNAVATLMYHCGVSVDMNYGQNSSSALSDKPAPAFTNYFRYSKSIRNEYREYYSDEAWEELIYNELAQQRPILYSGQAGKSGHAFVCDGYKADDNTYHMNWGWGGYCDCFVVLTGDNAIKPGGSGTGGAGSEAAYNEGQQAIINIIPSEGGIENPELRNNTNTIYLVNGSENITTYQHSSGSSKTLKLTENVWNLSRTLTSFTLGVKLTDTSTGLTYYLTDGAVTSIDYSNLADKTLTFDVNEIPYNGVYTVKMVARNATSTSDNDWYDVAVKSSVVLPTITITGAATQDPTEKAVVLVHLNKTEISIGKTEQIHIADTYDGTPSYSSSNTDVATVTNGVITAVGEGTATITVTLPETSTCKARTVTYYIIVPPDGLIFSKSPYFANANPWAEDMKIHLPLYNNSDAAFINKIVMIIHFKGTNYRFNLSLTLPANTYYDWEIDLSKYSSYFKAGEGQECSIDFYTDTSLSKPFNIPSITFVYQDYLAGDVTNDSKLSLDDALSIAARVKSNESYLNKADFNSDGKVDILDVCKLINYLKNK